MLAVIIQGQIEDPASCQDAGISHCHIQPAKFSAGQIHRPFQVAIPGHVACHCHRTPAAGGQFRRQRLDSLDSARHQYRARAFAREFPCQTRANTGRGAGNQYNLSVESVPPGSRHGNTILALSATIHTPAQEWLLNRRKAGRPKTSSPQWSHLRPIQANSEGHLSPRGNEASDVLPEQHVPEYLKGQGPCSQSRILAVLAASGPAVRPSDATARSTDIRMMSARSELLDSRGIARRGLGPAATCCLAPSGATSKGVHCFERRDQNAAARRKQRGLGFRKGVIEKVSYYGPSPKFRAEADVEPGKRRPAIVGNDDRIRESLRDFR